MTIAYYKLLRLYALVKKEFINIRRSLLTYMIIIAMPFAEVILFGYIINTDAKHLPTIVVAQDSSQLTNSIILAFANSGYFSIQRVTQDADNAEKLLEEGKTQFIITIPAKFTSDLIANRHPHILLDGDAADPMSVNGAFHAVHGIEANALKEDLKGPLQYLAPAQSRYTIDTHARYNPSLITQYHTLPGLIVTILTFTLIMITTVSIVSEYEHGTMELLLTTPLNSLELILGKMLPNVVLGYILFFLTLMVSRYLFHVPFMGSLLLLTITVFPFMIANLGIGIAVSTTAKTQFDAVNIATTYVLPSILFSGFMFPFYAMPSWAQWIGNLLPSTHYLRILSNIVLKGAGVTEIWPDLWPIIIFSVGVIVIGLRYFRQTLD